MMRNLKITSFILVMVAFGSIVGFTARGPQGSGSDKLPITTDGEKVGILLRQWWKEGTAAGNVGDFYDNRDRNHSPLDLPRFPQLSAIKYSPEDVRLGKDWAVARVILPHVTFGNSSTAAPAHLGGSNPRNYYVTPVGVSFLYNQYVKNNLYIYPEHRDHDPGHNGVYFPASGPRDEGYGDMYPTNTPYLIISQGSSGSDQPFMRMMPFVLAAFRPEVKKKLTETGLLMPTIQMLLRSTNKHLKEPKEYLTGKAHPTVFEGSWVDELAMAQKAHDLELKVLPPMARFRIVDEDKTINGIDFFEIDGGEVVANTPACVARIHRRKAYTQRLVVNADASFDVNSAKLTYTWVILRGDPAKIKIVPRKDDQSIAEITVAYHERRPVSPGAPLESNRVDIGVFVHNGTYYSAPAFITFCTLDREARTYAEDGKLLEIAHGLGETETRVKDWDKVLTQIREDGEAGKMLEISQDHVRAMPDIIAELRAREVLLGFALADSHKANERWVAAKKTADETKAEKAAAYAQKSVAEAQKRIEDHLNGKQKALGDSPRHFVESRLAKLTRDPLFMQTHAEWLKKNRTPVNEARFNSQWKRLTDFGIANDKEVMTPFFPGKTLSDAKWTAFERSRLECFNASLLADLVFPGTVEVIWRTNYVDPRLSAPREWRDVYRYDGKGEFIGWTRYSAAGVQLFNHEGLLVVEKDAQMRCVKGRPVRYVQDPWTKQGINQNLLHIVPGETLVRYEFDGADDLRGRRVGEAAKDKK